MSSTKRYTTPYTAADIEKYLRGELSPREMHDLENAALEDPFLADALDGMSVHTENAGLDSDVDELKRRLNARVTTGPDRNSIRRPILRWPVAAAIILLLGIGCAVYYTFLTSARSKIIAPAPSATAASSPADSPSPPVAASPPQTDNAASPKQATPPTPPPSAAPAEPPLLARSNAPAPARHAPPPAVIAVKPPATLDSSTRISMANELYKRAAKSLVFSGRVLDTHDNPVPGASLTLKGYRNTGTVTDQQGQFKLYLPPQDSSRYLTVAMVGYGQKSFPLTTLTANNITDHIIHLQPDDAALQEVVVSGFASKRKETMASVPSISGEKLDSLWLKAWPVIGRAAYLYYLDTARKTLALDSSITGTETVSFEVDKKGALTSFKIEQSLSPAHDEAIIRLVKNGPAWRVLKQKKVRVTVSLHF